MGKYDGDQFCDPVLRCTECQRIIFQEEIAKIGKCPNCGCRKVRNVLTLSDSEEKLLKNKNVDPEFLELFEVVNG
jgi:rRNA maturation endonuclease Nob1